MPKPGIHRRTVRVPLAGAAYDVVIGLGVISELGEQARRALPDRDRARAVIVADANVPAAIVETARASLVRSGWGDLSLTVTGGETSKRLAEVERLLAAMADARLERRDVVVSLGGGAVGDMVGFAASIYRRGLGIVQVPTTLLAMVDASVGGKTGVNLQSDAGLLKNMVGTFHQPSLVIADVGTLVSLDPREFRCGLAECVKHAMVASHAGVAGLWELTKTVDPADPASLVGLVAGNVGVKAAIVAGDERETASDEQGGRALLNLGHTFGHALESLDGLEWLTPEGRAFSGRLRHGEAVAFGLVAASACSAAISRPDGGLVREDLPDQVRSLLERFGLSTRARGIPSAAAMREVMLGDKKVERQRLRLVLPRSIGTAGIRVVETLEPVAKGLEAIRTA